MIKTNSKEARQGIREYLLENYCPDGYDEYEETSSLKQIARNVLSCFYDEKVKYDSRKMIFEDLFLEWLSGLPTILNADYYLHSAKAVLGDILQESQEERDRFSEQQAEEQLGRMIWSELLRLAPMWPFC